jgi:SAM-dependent methyltransferase
MITDLPIADAKIPASVTDASRFIAEAFLIVLGRDVNPIELRDTLRGFTPEAGEALVARLLSSPEFRLVHDALLEDRETGRDLAVEERSLQSLCASERFVDLAYAHLLGRPADPAGRAHYVSAMAAGDSRISILRSLIRSDEFAARYRRLSPEGGVVPVDTQLCELANPAKWDNPEWMAVLRDLGLPDHKLSMHRKFYEFTQLAYGLGRLGQLRDDATVLSVGAGHESILFWLANRMRHVIATDRYAGIWQDVQAREGDRGVLRSPRDYAPFPYREDRLTFLEMDALHLGFAANTFDAAYSLSSIELALEFPDASFDIVFSLSSIEHFGGLAGAARAVDEMIRVVKPGGIVALATEYVLDGPPHEETFTSADFAALIARPGATAVAPFDATVYRRYAYAAVDLYRNPHQTPHMVVRFDDTVFTTAFVFLRKDAMLDASG